jgi:hypothetical protein
MATNVAKIDAFVATGQRDTEGVHRKRRKRRRTTRQLSDWAPAIPARSGAPPG